jgi:hypothetical protein
MEREIIVIGYTAKTEGIVIEGFFCKGEYNTNLAKSSISKYDRHFEIDITDMTPEQIMKEYSEVINDRKLYTSILTSDNRVKITTITSRYPLKHMLSCLMTGGHTIMYGGNIDIEINITSSDYYYGEDAVITSSEVTAF